MEPLRQYKLKSGNVLKIFQEDDPESPRDDDNLGVMVCFHNRYKLGDKHDYNPRDYAGWDEMEAAIIKAEKPVAMLPLYLYDHSGLRMKVGSFQGLLPQGHAEFDSGQVGFIFARAKDVLESWSVKRISPKLKEKVEEVLRSEVETYDQYLCGDIYWFEVVKPEKCDKCGNVDEEVVDSCGGFYGSDPKKNGMMDNIRDEIVEEL